MTVRLLTAQQVADLLGEHVQTIRTKTRRGQIPGAINISAGLRPTWRYDQRRIEAWLKRQAA